MKTIKLLQEGQQAIHETLPGVMEGFRDFSRSVIDLEQIPLKVKELIAVAVAVGIKCQPCIVHHVKLALDQKATAEEIMEACGVAITMGGGPAVAYTSYVVQALKDFKALEKEGRGGFQDAL
jgi:AhpD family alkylhydroperoxidase